MTNGELQKAAFDEYNAEQERKSIVRIKDCIAQMVVQQNIIKVANAMIMNIKDTMSKITIDTVDSL